MKHYLLFSILLWALASSFSAAKVHQEKLIGDTTLSLDRSKWVEISLGNQVALRIFENKKSALRVYLKSSFEKVSSDQTPETILSGLCQNRVLNKKANKKKLSAQQTCFSDHKEKLSKKMTITHQFVKQIKRRGKKYFAIHQLNAPTISDKKSKAIIMGLYDKFN